MKKLLIILIIISIISCERKTEPPIVVQELSFDRLNSLGWQEFSIEKYNTSITYFDQVLAKDSINTTANIGKGWSLLMLDINDLDSIEVFLRKGLKDAAWKSDARCGLAVIRFHQQQYTEIETLIDLVLADKPEYFFQYKPTIDWHDLLLLKAQAFFFIEEYNKAWYTIQRLTAVYSLNPNDHSSWIVDEKKYFSFEAALSKVIEFLSDLYKE